MNQSILAIRILILVLAAMGGFMVWYLFPDVTDYWFVALSVGLLLGALLVLVDILLKGFSLRALTGLTFGLGIGLLASHFITISPLFDGGDPQVIYISRLVVFISVTYLATVVALRGRDEFNLVIPYVRFQSEKVESPLVILDTSCLVDGRVAKLCAARLVGDVLAVPKFVVDELHELAASNESEEKNRGNRGLKTLGELKELPHVELRVHESEVSRDQSRDDKILFVVSSLKGRLMTTSEQLVRKAKQQGATFIDILNLTKALTQEVAIGEAITVKLVKLGREDSQGVGYLSDGSMVVVNNGSDYLNSEVMAEVDSIIPTSGGRMVFAKLLGENK